MAEKRMFAKTIIDSDAFLDMPLSAQALYFHLSMRADDEGFINNPKRIQRLVGASEDDLKLLIMKKFLLTFDTGVVVIKHWRINNYLQKDRRKPTLYQHELSMLGIKPNKAYTFNFDDPATKRLQDVSKKDTKRIPVVSSSDTECVQDVSSSDTECIHDVYDMDTECIQKKSAKIDENRMDTEKNKLRTTCIQDVYKMDTQDRIDKDSIDKINIYLSIDHSEMIDLENYRFTDEQLQRIHLLYEQIKEQWNTLSDYGLSRLSILGFQSVRGKKLFERLYEFGISSFEEIVRQIKASKYLQGQIDGALPARFEWVVDSCNNYKRVLEGYYKDWPPKDKKPVKHTDAWSPQESTYRDADFKELEEQLLDN